MGSNYFRCVVVGGRAKRVGPSNVRQSGPFSRPIMLVLLRFEENWGGPETRASEIFMAGWEVDQSLEGLQIGV